MNPWSVVPLSSLAVALAFVALVGRRRRPSAPAKLLLLFMVCFAVWSLGEAVARLLPNGTDRAVIFQWIRVEWIGIALVPATLVHFFILYVGSALGQRRWFLPAVYGPAVLVAGLIGLSDLIVGGWEPGPFGPSAILGPAYLPSAAWWSGALASAWIVLASGFLRGDALFRRRSLPVLVTLTIVDVLGPITETWWPFFTASRTGLGLDTVYVLAVGVALVYAETRLHFLPVVAVTEAPSLEKPRDRPEPGLSHLYLARHRDAAFAAFRELVGRVPGLCVSGVYPPRLQERYGLEATPIVWLTTLSRRGLAARPSGLEFEVQLTAMRFMRENPATVVLVDDLDYLNLTNGFDAVARFLKRLANHAAVHGSIVIACTDPEAFSQQQMAMLRAMFDRVLEFAPPAGREPRPPVEGPGALLLEGPSSEALEVYRSLAKGDNGVIVSTKNPERLRRLHHVSLPVVWLSETQEEGLADRPVALDLDAAKMAVARLGDRLHPMMFVPDLEQLKLVAPFPKALEFVKGLIDQMAVRDGVLVASVEPQALSTSELAAIRRRFDRARGLA